MHTGRMGDPATFGASAARDPLGLRDPRGLRGDAPLLDAWLRFTEQARAGGLTPMSVPGHKQRQDLSGAVVAGDVPLYGGLDTIKHADALLAEAQRRASGMPTAVAVATVRAALAAHPRARAVFLGDPSYAGAAGDLAGHAAAAHQAGVPLIVDAAWAAHFGFHPDLPPHALAAGADAMVTSAHKALPAYTQGALVLARTGLLDPARLDRAFEATHTTSPAGAIMASIDAARALLARDGWDLSARLLRVVRAAKHRLRLVSGLRVLDGPWVEPTKLVLLLAGTGAHGHAVEADLIEAGMPVEMADQDTVVPIMTLADDEAAVSRFTVALIAAVERHRSAPRRPALSVAWTVTPQPASSPREAFFAPHETVTADAAPGRVSAEIIAPYPPGVPVLAPGEIITQDLLDGLRAVLSHGGRVAYAADPTLATIQVVRS